MKPWFRNLRFRNSEDAWLFFGIGLPLVVAAMIGISIFMSACVQFSYDPTTKAFDYRRLGDQKVNLTVELDAESGAPRKITLAQESQAQALNDMAQSMKNLSELAAKGAAVP